VPKVTYLPSGIAYEFDPATLPYSDHGQPGSLLDVALNAGVDLNHDCGGFCSCTTCHVIVVEGMENLSKQEPDEDDLLDTVGGRTRNYRLGCQSIVKGDVTVRIP
jgi:2Fe-2S ferredoxin